MHFTIYISLFLFIYPSDGANTSSVVDGEREDVLHITDTLLNLLGTDDKNDSTRIKELRDKVTKIDSYVIDRDQYIERLLNESKSYILNETNFYNALQEKDHYSIISEKDSRNLYLKLKEKMNRDDLLQVLSERGEKKIKKSARRMMDRSYLAKKRTEKDLDDAVDKYLGEAPHDKHKFSDQDRYSQYWDPQVELIERRSYHQPSGRRLFKGERTTVRYYPFMVSVHIMEQFWCGGVLFWYDLVITSAACLQLMHNNRFFRENSKALGIRVGSNHSRIGGQFIDALEVYFHPSYKPRTLENNIAVIRLRDHLKINYHRIPKLIGLSYNDGGVPFTAEILLLGWGVSKTRQKLPFEPLYLQRKILPVYPNSLCKEIYGKQFNPKSMFCAGTVSTGEGACDHDAGGPAILNGKLVGIISYGPAICGYPDAPTVLTLVGMFADWIETVNETMPQYYRGKRRTTTTKKHPYVKYLDNWKKATEDFGGDAHRFVKKKEFSGKNMRAKASQGSQESQEEMPADYMSTQKELRMGNSEDENHEVKQIEDPTTEKNHQFQALSENVMQFQQKIAENMKRSKDNKHKDTVKTALNNGDSLINKNKLSALRDDTTHNEDSSQEKKADNKRLKEELHLKKLAESDATYTTGYKSELNQDLEYFTTRSYAMELRALLNSYSKSKGTPRAHEEVYMIQQRRRKQGF